MMRQNIEHLKKKLRKRSFLIEAGTIRELKYISRCVKDKVKIKIMMLDEF